MLLLGLASEIKTFRSKLICSRPRVAHAKLSKLNDVSNYHMTLTSTAILFS